MQFDKQTTAPMRVVSTTSRWRTPDGGHRPVLCIANGRSRIFIDPSEFRDVVTAMARVIDAEDDREVAA